MQSSQPDKPKRSGQPDHPEQSPAHSSQRRSQRHAPGREDRDDDRSPDAPRGPSRDKLAEVRKPPNRR